LEQSFLFRTAFQRLHVLADARLVPGDGIDFVLARADFILKSSDLILLVQNLVQRLLCGRSQTLVLN
jgi:hypothetical protein